METLTTAFQELWKSMIETMTDPVAFHLRVNHFPIILVFVGAAACSLAIAVRRDAVWRYALVTVLLAAVTTPLAYWTGLRAEDIAEGFEMIDAGMMAEHEESALIAGIVIVLAGIAAAVALAKPRPALRYAAAAFTLAAAGAAAWTGAHAGKITHNVDTEGRPLTEKADDRDAPRRDDDHGGDDSRDDDDR